MIGTEVFITTSQIQRALAAIPVLQQKYAKPMARLQTNMSGVILEVENLHQDNGRRLTQLQAQALNGQVRLRVSSQTGNNNREQYLYNNLNDGSYIVVTNVRDTGALNFFSYP
jgi:hypothetical protein